MKQVLTNPIGLHFPDSQEIDHFLYNTLRYCLFTTLADPQLDCQCLPGSAGSWARDTPNRYEPLSPSLSRSPQAATSAASLRRRRAL